MEEDILFKYSSKFDEKCQEWDTYLAAGNSKKANKCYKEIKNIFNIASDATKEDRENFYRDILEESVSIMTISVACVHMLIFDIDTKKAIKKLKKISKMPLQDSSAVFSSKMAIREWKSGRLKGF